jgi:hypothetical protein
VVETAELKVLKSGPRAYPPVSTLSTFTVWTALEGVQRCSHEHLYEHLYPNICLKVLIKVLIEHL